MKIQTIQAKNILTKSPVHGDFTASPYAGCVHNCVYCYAQYLKDWTGHENEEWGEYIDVKEWEPPTPKQKEHWRGKSVFISSATDPYQPVEMKYRRTRALLEQLVGLDMDVSIITKSALVLRDIDIFKELNATVALSINTLDEGFKNDMDKASSIEDRIKALDTLHKEGVHSVCFISPIFPGITNVPEIIEEMTGVCDAVWIEHLVLNGDYKGPVLYYVKTHYPEYYSFYDEIFNKGNLDLWWEFDDYMDEWCAENGYEYQYGKFPKEHHDLFPTVSNFRGHKGK